MINLVISPICRERRDGPIVERQCWFCNDWKPRTAFFDPYRQRTNLGTCGACCIPRKANMPNPMLAIKTKSCARCGVSKPNDFDHFGTKLWFDRYDYTTTDMCLECTDAKRRETLRKKFE